MSIREEYLYLTDSGKDNKDAIERLAEIIALLRRECPWDKVQTHETLRKGMIEEAYEVVEAINNKDMANLREELGDVLLQIVFHADLAKEEGEFDLKDIINEECEKMIRRHPHVFLQETQNNSTKSIDKVLEKWENIKVEEKHEKSCASRLERVPKALPALVRAFKLQKKAAKCGFAWESAAECLGKLEEETAELRHAIEEGVDPSEELGDMLFAAVNVAAFLQKDPEQVLHDACEKFIRRFGAMESAARQAGRSLDSLSREELLSLWSQQKTKEQKDAAKA